ncbi:NADH-quinone oxidoreductase subunit A [Desulfoluna butyratoxydans]|uniref:NADH-quinone oxidoreductase subunit n=1 Tax=Desulfoluna butyratoxydans TaxID=231438 RepID=A0A4U8YNP8_9BACT|nr:NADH-quinone oxidoreductase subunit A [Desulfoluna butyratoxydans]VFQ45746.1 nadh:ubiquinone/plastoquinone oxidoreductase chain 3 [Desulfoluna butyratoxydans]
MESTLALDYIYVMFFILGGFIAAFLPFVIAWMLRPATVVTTRTHQTYECGIEPFNQMWDYRFGISYYLYALIFLAFDVDVLYLFPVATVFNAVPGIRGAVEFSIFIGILSLAVVYAWAKGVFTWEKRKQ